MSGLLYDVDSATIDRFSSIASLRAANPKQCHWKCHKRLQEACVIIANVIVNFFSADAFLDQVLASSKGPGQQMVTLQS